MVITIMTNTGSYIILSIFVSQSKGSNITLKMSRPFTVRTIYLSLSGSDIIHPIEFKEKIIFLKVKDGCNSTLLTNEKYSECHYKQY